ncbi:hypothetical protein Trydic_g13970 [Trypoxylus dichotomus]
MLNEDKGKFGQYNTKRRLMDTCRNCHEKIALLMQLRVKFGAVTGRLVLRSGGGGGGNIGGGYRGSGGGGGRLFG